MRSLIKSIFRVFTPVRMLLILGVAAFLWFLIFGDQGIYHLNKLSIMKRKLVHQKEMLTKDIERLSREKALLQEPKNLEPYIRKELGFIRPGEIVYQEKEDK